MNTKWLVKNWFRVGKKISWKLSFETLISLLYFIPFFKRSWVYSFVKKKHKYVLSYIDRKYSYLIDKYKNVPIKQTKSDKHYIWVMWWQGEENAPDLVKMCLSSIRKNANGAEVIVITKDNFNTYADIPSYIIEKHKAGFISFAQLSDIMRVFLISKHGGLWLDATIYVSSPIPQKIFEMSLFSLHTKERKTPFIQNNKIHCFVLGGIPESKPFIFEREFLSTYWETHDVIIDYYLLDYSIMYQYYKLDDIKKLIDSLEYTSEGLYDLVAILDDPYDENKLNEILSKNLFSKLVWNQKHNVSLKNTNYQYLKLVNSIT